MCWSTTAAGRASPGTTCWLRTCTSILALTRRWRPALWPRARSGDETTESPSGFLATPACENVRVNGDGHRRDAESAESAEATKGLCVLCVLRVSAVHVPPVSAMDAQTVGCLQRGHGDRRGVGGSLGRREMLDGAGDGLVRGEERAGDGALPHSAARRLSRGAVQGAEH